MKKVYISIILLITAMFGCVGFISAEEDVAYTCYYQTYDDTKYGTTFNMEIKADDSGLHNVIITPVNEKYFKEVPTENNKNTQDLVSYNNSYSIVKSSNIVAVEETKKVRVIYEIEVDSSNIRNAVAVGNGSVGVCPASLYANVTSSDEDILQQGSYYRLPLLFTMQPAYLDGYLSFGLITDKSSESFSKYKLYTDNTCLYYLGEPLADFLQTIFNIIKIIAVLAFIALTILDFSLGISKSDNDIVKKSMKKTGTRAIIVVLIFLLPTLINLIMNLFGFAGTCGIK